MRLILVAGDPANREPADRAERTSHRAEFAIEVLPAVLLTAVIAAVVSSVGSVLLVLGPAISHDHYAKL